MLAWNQVALLIAPPLPWKISTTANPYPAARDEKNTGLPLRNAGGAMAN